MPRSKCWSVPERLMALVFAAVLLAAAPARAANEPDDPSARDLQRIVGWFGGIWDNSEQIWFETEGRAQVPVPERHERVHATHRRVDLPSIGRYVFYVEEYRDDDPAKVFRQRLVVFESAREQGVRMRLGLFRDAAAVLGAASDPARLAGLHPEALIWLPGCEVYWRAEGDQYVGGMRPKACTFGEGREQRWSQHDLLLSATKYWRVDRSFNVRDGKLAVGHPGGVPHKLDRARLFECEVRLFGGNYLAGQGASPSDRILTGQRLHSQGGTLHVENPADGARWQIRLRDKEYPYYERWSDFMFLSVRRAGEPSIALSLHDRDARFLGVNVGWMSVACDRIDPP